VLTQRLQEKYNNNNNNNNNNKDEDTTVLPNQGVQTDRSWQTSLT
jgi:hypothetical protein